MPAQRVSVTGEPCSDAVLIVTFGNYLVHLISYVIQEQAALPVAVNKFLLKGKEALKIQLVEAAAAVGAADYRFLFEGGLYAPDGPMYATGLRRLLSLNTNKTYSPITLNNEWPATLRIGLLSLFGLIGTLVNGFFVASFFVELPLRKAGYVYLACLGFADLIITTGVIPTSAVVILSKVWELASVCYCLEFLSEGATYLYSLLFLMVALETYIRLCKSPTTYNKFLEVPVGLVAFALIVISFTVSAVGVYLDLDYDYCTRLNFGDSTFRLVTALLFQCMPFGFTVSLLIITAFLLRSRANRLVRYKRSKQYERDYNFTRLNMVCYLAYVLAWLPYLVIVNLYPSTADKKFYNSAWLGLSRSIVTSSMYSGINKYFRNAFVRIFYYFCCKSTMVPPYNHRHRRTHDYKVPSGDVRVHVMSPPVLKSVPRAGGAGPSRETYTMQL